MTQSPLETRFWSKVNRNGPTPTHCPELGPCWIWTGKTNDSGYGIAWDVVNHKEMRAHRASWQFKNGSIPPGMVICHKCDNPPCVNPSHLFVGTKLDNARDALSKGRLSPQVATITRLWKERREEFIGENAAHSKLTTTKVLEMRRLYALGGISTRQLGLHFGICQQSAHDIIRFKTWKHLKGVGPPATGEPTPIK